MPSFYKVAFFLFWSRAAVLCLTASCYHCYLFVCISTPLNVTDKNDIRSIKAGFQGLFNCQAIVVYEITCYFT